MKNSTRAIGDDLAGRWRRGHCRRNNAGGTRRRSAGAPAGESSTARGGLQEVV